MNIKKRYNFSGIYQILNLVNGKRYIGQAQNIAKRIYEHHRIRNTGYLQKAIIKYGWNSFEISVIKTSTRFIASSSLDSHPDLAF